MSAKPKEESLVAGSAVVSREGAVMKVHKLELTKVGATYLIAKSLATGIGLDKKPTVRGAERADVDPPSAVA